MTNGEHEYFRLAIEEARKSVDEQDGRIHPRVGVVVVKDGKMLAAGHRGELEKGEHAEYTVLERKLKNETLTGATVYCTLEPCTTRKHPKVPCAERIAERKVGRVMIGMVDPNPEISGRGQQLLRQANIEVGLFPGLYASEIEEMNRDFSRFYKKGSPKQFVSPEWVKENRSRPLDEWYRSINVMYWNRNFYKSAADIFAHLVEVVGGLSLLASQKKKVGVKPETFVAKSVAWWLALCGRVGIDSVSDLLWSKFPGICPYCHKNPHAPGLCLERKKKNPGPDWIVLSQFGKQSANSRPRSLRDWQVMFSDIYEVGHTEEYAVNFGRLTEELGELAEAIRVFQAAPGYFLSEAADVFAWLMHIQNLIEHKSETQVEKKGEALAELFAQSYPDKCLDCGSRVCNCPPILEGTIGRIAHEVQSSK
ncbi:MAG TPA: deaminase, partial [Candidatus Angelobacter sp.]|nr:deaminase [Candidatus Angelobacter sp.]